MPVASHELFDWRWFQFLVWADRQYYVPVLEVLAAHDGKLVDDARTRVAREAQRLNLGIGLGVRGDDGVPNIIRDRSQIWKMTGTLHEPGLVGDEIRVTDLGRAILDDAVTFEEAMRRQMLRLATPRIAIAGASGLARAVDKLNEALACGTGVNFVRALAIANGLLRAEGETTGVTGEEIVKFLSGAPSLSAIELGASQILSRRRKIPSALDPDERVPIRQGNELLTWFERFGVTVDDATVAYGLDPVDRSFTFASASITELERWSQWWGSWPTDGKLWEQSVGAS